MLKISRYIWWTRALNKISRASLKLRKYMYLPKHGKWPSQHLNLKINCGLVPCQKKSQAVISESSHVQWSFIQQKANLSLQPCSLNNTLNRPSSAWAKTRPVCFRGHSHIKSSHSLCQIDRRMCVAHWC